MSKTAFLFPGQGVQYVGMGRDIYERYASAKNVYKNASKVLGMDIEGLCFSSTEEEINRTDNAQIAILVTSLAALEVLKEKEVRAQIAAGLSLGEYTACIYNGMIGFEDGLRLVQKRGKYMQELTPSGDWKMAAIIELDAGIIEETCKKVSEETGFVAPSNYNYSGQVVISGEAKAVDIAIQLLIQKGAKKVSFLKTSGPFHTIKLEKAEEEFEKELENIKVNKGEITVIKNIDGLPYNEDDNVKEIWANHMISPVRFDKTIEYMKSQKIDNFIEIGPGKTLTGFIKREIKEVNLINVNNVESLEGII
ncbi:MAG: ACP S-malonyltransferase [Oscillospiraceae bacterium]|nr:ACP S-malonyltransferase [Oscillospiraceae bacterium]